MVLSLSVATRVCKLIVVLLIVDLSVASANDQG